MLHKAQQLQICNSHKSWDPTISFIYYLSPIYLTNVTVMLYITITLFLTSLIDAFKKIRDTEEMLIKKPMYIQNTSNQYCYTF